MSHRSSIVRKSQEPQQNSGGLRNGNSCLEGTNRISRRYWLRKREISGHVLEKVLKAYPNATLVRTTGFRAEADSRTYASLATSKGHYTLARLGVAQNRPRVFWVFLLKRPTRKGYSHKGVQESAIAHVQLAPIRHWSSPHPHAYRRPFLPRINDGVSLPNFYDVRTMECDD